MKLVTFRASNDAKARVGAILDDNKILDLYLASMRFGGGRGSMLFRNMISFVSAEQKALSAAERLTKQYFKGHSQLKRFVSEFENCIIHAPIPRPGKIIHTTGNFQEHQREVASAGFSESWVHPWVSFLKRADAVIGASEPIVYPRITKQLDYEIELAIVIRKKCKYIGRSEALDCVAGYTIFNDISARDIQMEEHRHAQVNVGKNLDTFAPMGPCLATKDEIPDPHDLQMELRVNGDVRQKGSTKSMRVTIPELIEHYSCMTLNPGDILTTGTISGSAYFRPDRDRFFLKVGDVVEAQIDKIGILRNKVIADSTA